MNHNRGVCAVLNRSSEVSTDAVFDALRSVMRHEWASRGCSPVRIERALLWAEELSRRASSGVADPAERREVEGSLYPAALHLADRWISGELRLHRSQSHPDTRGVRSYSDLP